MGGGKEEREKKQGGRRPLLLILFGLGGGARGPALAASPLFHLGPLSPYLCQGLPGTPSGDLVSPETLSVSEYSLPTYESLPLDHFETPRHVRDLIRDSEQTSIIKSHNS